MKREEEIKYLLAGPEDHGKLLGPGGLSGLLRCERQENLYFDTADLRLAQAMTMLRVRAVRGESPLLTLKSGTEVEAGFFRSHEIEAPLPVDVLPDLRRRPGSILELFLAPVRELRARFGEPPLVLIGVLLNERTLFRSGGFLLEVDRMTFPDGSEEYEVEVETDDPRRASAWLLEEFRRLGIRADPSRRTKFERLLRKL